MNAPSPGSPPLPRPTFSRARLASLLQKQGALVALVVLCAVAATRYEAFGTPENVLNVLRQNSMVGLLALGMTLVILTGGIDLSVGALLAVGGVVGAALSHHGSAIAVVGAVLTTGALGLVNGLVITRARVSPFITTLAMMFAARGLLLVFTHEDSVRVARTASLFKWIGRGYVGPLPMPVVVLFVAFALGWAMLGHTRFGRHVYAVGDNTEAARLMGLNVDRVTVGVYALSGIFAGLAGVLLASRVGVGQPVAAAGWELSAITAVVLGGTLLSGGQGGAGPTLVGVLLLGIVFNVFNLEGTISSYYQRVLSGAFLLIVVVIQNRLSRQRAAGDIPAQA